MGSGEEVAWPRDGTGKSVKSEAELDVLVYVECDVYLRPAVAAGDTQNKALKAHNFGGGESKSPNNGPLVWQPPPPSDSCIHEASFRIQRRRFKASLGISLSRPPFPSPQRHVLLLLRLPPHLPPPRRPPHFLLTTSRPPPPSVCLRRNDQDGRAHDA